jgi:hypothetical protein
MASLAQKLNQFIVKDYFDKLKELLMRLDIMDKPEWIYNVDEKGCRLCLNIEPKVQGQEGAKRVHSVAHEHGGEYFSSFMWKCNGDCSTILHMSGHIISTVQVIWPNAYLSENNSFSGTHDKRQRS